MVSLKKVWFRLAFVLLEGTYQPGPWLLQPCYSPPCTLDCFFCSLMHNITGGWKTPGTHLNRHP